ncbi:MAG TPA: hypothetical protein VFW25_02340 [Silvibacterium sp.]|nr:hypothetical protein [Silvibacterium sp.]
MRRRRFKKGRCSRSPIGWRCTREPGHSGPCAARRSTRSENVVLIVCLVLFAAVCFFAAAAFGQDGRQAHYRHDGPALLPDLNITPGVVRTGDARSLCAKSFHTGTVRAVSESTRQAVCRAYGIAKEGCTGAKVEIDHLISLELGGSNDPQNLWPEPYAPKPGAKEKDIVENRLHAQVCAGKIPLEQAQHEISQDWYWVYRKRQEKHGPR